MRSGISNIQMVQPIFFDPNKGSIRCHNNPADHIEQLKKVINCYPPSTETNSQSKGTNHKIEIKKATPNKLPS